MGELDEIIGSSIKKIYSKTFNEFEVRFTLLPNKVTIGKTYYNVIKNFLDNSNLFKKPIRSDYRVALYTGISKTSVIRCIQKGKNVTWETKQKEIFGDYEFTDMFGEQKNIRFSGALEEEIVNPFPKGVPLPNSRRNIIRHSYMFVPEKLSGVKIDLSIVDTCKTTNNELLYELEIEFTDNPKPNTKKVEYVVNMFMNLFKFFGEFDSNIHKNIVKKMTKLFPDERIQNNAPITFTSEHLNIFKDNVYAITNKLDGERVYLFISRAGCFVVSGNTSRSMWLPLKVPNDISDTVLDAELYFNRYTSQLSIQVFDAIIINNENVMNEGLNNRLKKANEVVNKINSENIKNIISVKKYWCTSVVQTDLANCEMYMNINFKEDENDGIVFTSLFGKYSSKVYKLKPINRMSIDVILKEVSRKDFTVNVLSKIKGKDSLTLFTGTRQYPFDGVLQISEEDFNRYLTNNYGDKLISNVVELEWREHLKSFIITRERKDKEYPNVVSVAQTNWEFINNPVNIQSLIEYYLLYDNKSKKVDNIDWTPYPKFSEKEQQTFNTKKEKEQLKLIEELQTTKSNDTSINNDNIFVKRLKEYEQKFQTIPKVVDDTQVIEKEKIIETIIVENKKEKVENKKELIKKYKSSKNILKNFNNELGINYVVEDVPGDGSCFFHSLMYLISDKYFESSSHQRKEIVIKERNLVANGCTYEKWEKYSHISIPSLQMQIMSFLDSNIKKAKSETNKVNYQKLKTLMENIFIDLDKEKGVTTVTQYIENINNKLSGKLSDKIKEVFINKIYGFAQSIHNQFVERLQDPKTYVTQDMLIYISSHYNINIFLIHNRKIPYNYGKIDYYSNTQNIVMNYEGNHFEPIIGDYNYGETQITSFSLQDPFIQRLIRESSN